MGVQVDEAGQEDQAVGVDGLVGRRGHGPDLADQPVLDVHVRGLLPEQAGTLDEQTGHLPSLMGAVSPASRW